VVTEQGRRLNIDILVTIFSQMIDSKGKRRELVDEVLKKVGRNILFFGQVEKGLKILLPYIVLKAHQKGIESFKEYPEKVKSKTLGNLINAYHMSHDYDPEDLGEEFKKDFKKLLDDRNNLVHHFGGTEGIKILDTEAGCKKVIAQLDIQYQEATSFYKEITLNVFCVIMLLREAYPEYKQKFEPIYQQLRAEIANSDVEFIHLDNPTETIWENTIIVKLLRLAELNTDKINDMTDLERAGLFIKNHAPECTPKKYGMEKLKNVLKASKLFEIVESYNKISVLYRSKIIDTKIVTQTN
jgi:hypothetical protein